VQGGVWCCGVRDPGLQTFWSRSAMALVRLWLWSVWCVGVGLAGECVGGSG